MKKIIFIFLCFSFLSIGLCQDSSTSKSSESNSKSSEKKGPSFILRLLDRVASSVTKVLAIPFKLTWSTSVGLFLTPISYPVKIITTAMTKVGEVISVIIYDIEKSMEKAKQDLSSSSDDKSDNSESKSRRRRSAPEEKPDVKSLFKSSEDKPEVNSLTQSSVEKSDEKPFNKSSEDKPNEKSLETPSSTFNFLNSTKNIFKKCVSFFNSMETQNIFKKCISFVTSLETKNMVKNSINIVSSLFRKSSNVGKSLAKLVEDGFIIFKMIKPIYSYICNELLPSTVERLVKIEHSPLASTKIVHRIDNVKDTYKLLEVFGYVPSLTTD